MFKKSRRLCAISYLIARLEWALEVSKLTIMNFRPKTRIVEMARTETLHPPECWVMTPAADYFLFIENHSKRPTVKSFPEKVYN